jgi:hypothetical protein
LLPVSFLAGSLVMTRIGSRVPLYGTPTLCFVVGQEYGDSKSSQYHQNKRQEAEAGSPTALAYQLL